MDTDENVIILFENLKSKSLIFLFILTLYLHVFTVY